MTPKPFVEHMEEVQSYWRIGIPKLTLIFLTDRDARFREGNDKTWGEGQWIRCEACLDTLGYPAYHHKDAHS